MEWLNDNTGIKPLDLKRVYKYSEGTTTSVKAFESEDRPVIQRFPTDSIPTTFIKEIPSLGGQGIKSGLIVLIARRVSTKDVIGSSNLCYAEKEKYAEDQEGVDLGDAEGGSLSESGGQQLTRILPFSQDTFERVSKSFYIHGSISPVISRADVPFFSYDEVFMKDNSDMDRKAWVYNCRSTNAWGEDLAMTVTHFPHCRLSFCVIFGCTKWQEEYIIQRVSGAMRESAHPLLLPGIFVEIERIRHLRIFESTIDDLEKAMPNTNVETMLNQQSAQIEALEQNKRSAYLEVLHLKQGLESWSTQLQKMVEHAQSLRSEYMSAEHILGHSSIVIKDSPCLGLRNLESSQKLNSTNCEGNLESWCSEKGGLQWECTATNVRPSTPKQNTDHVNEVLVQTTSKVTRRLRAILDEYTDKGRECQIRFDGITIATQLFQGETNLKLALATNKDSRHMKTIAVVTMVFLPGTFFATIFSMTFFNWQASGSEPIVSPSIWIYVTFSVALTALTLLIWYYFGTIRPKKLELLQLQEGDAAV